LSELIVAVVVVAAADGNDVFASVLNLIHYMTAAVMHCVVHGKQNLNLND